jgi:hypothetical protein
MTDAPNGWPPEAREALEYALASHFSRNRQPHMSGDPRARLSTMERRNFDDAIHAALAALAPHLAAREAAAFKRGAEASREQVAHWADAELADCELADAIRQIPHDLPEDKQ